jgi:hypothetical protein
MITQLQLINIIIIIIYPLWAFMACSRVNQEEFNEILR